MNKGVLYGLVIIFTAVAVAAGWFGHLHLHPHEQVGDTPEVVMLKGDLKRLRQEVDDFANERLPKLWIDNDAAATFKQFGYDYVYFIRWQNAVIDGWVEFDAADGPKRFPLDGSRVEADQRVKDGSKLVAKDTKGNILITLRQIGKSDEFDCEVKGDYSVATGTKGASLSNHMLYSEKGKLKLEAAEPATKGRFLSAWSGSEVNLKKFADEKSGSWVKIKLVELPK